MAKYVRVDIPVDKPEDTLKLCDKIIVKDTLDGAASSLTGVIYMTAFGTKVTDAKAKRAEAETKEAEALDKYQKAEIKAGLAIGQNKDTPETINWYVRQVKDLLLVIHKGNEEAMNAYGFEVIITQTGARKNIRITLPDKPEDMIELGGEIVAQHTLLGAGSPLTAALVDMIAFGTLVTDANTLLGEWSVLRGNIQALNSEALNIIGYGAGQTSSTAGTLYNILGSIRIRLLQKFQGNEEALNNWGFTVKTTQSTTGRKKDTQKISLQGKVTDKATGDVIANALIHLAEPDIYTTTDAAGKYLFYSIAPGTYTVQAHKAGYPDFEVANVQIKASALTLNIQLEIVTTVVLEGDLLMGNIAELITSNFSVTPSSTVKVEISGSEVVLSASDVAGPVLGPSSWHVFPGTQNKTIDAFGALVGADATHTRLKILNPLGPAMAHYKITFNNVTVL